jgi:DNA-binding NarL/FixJ family response regulator
LPEIKRCKSTTEVAGLVSIMIDTQTVNGELKVGRSRRVRYVVADPQELTRVGLGVFLESLPDASMVGEAGTLAETLRVVRRTKPTILFLGLRFPDGDGVDVIRPIKAELPRTRVMVVTMYGTPEYVVAAQRAGADGFISKLAGRDEFLATVRTTLDGGTLSSTFFANRGSREVTPDGAERFRRLTPRERQVLFYVGHGLTNREIAGEIGLRPGTVKVNVERLISKLGVANRTQAAIAADRYGLHLLVAHLNQQNAAPKVAPLGYDEDDVADVAGNDDDEE